MSAPSHRSPASQAILILTFGACGMATLLALLPAAGHDQMWLLYAARLHLQGAPLYGPTIFETNPPLILWLSAIPAALAPILHLPDTTVGKLLVLLLEAAIALLCLKLLDQASRVPQVSTASSSTLGLILPPTLPTPHILLLAYITAVAVLPARDFGQRDHLLTLFLLPYLFAAARRLANQPIPAPLAYLSGALALLGLALKPHQLLIPLTVELTLLLRKPKFPTASSSNQGLPPPPRVPQVSTASSSTLGLVPTAPNRFASLLRPELQALLTTGLLFLFAVHHFAPLYFTSVVPLARDTYWAYGGLTLPQLLAQSIQLHILLALNLALLFASRGRPVTPLTRILLTAGTAATLAFHLQGTGWYYQQLPALTFLTLALALQLIDVRVPHPFESHPKGWGIEPTARPSSPRPTQPFIPKTWLTHLPILATAFTLLTLALTTHFMNYPFTPARAFPIDQPDPAFFTALPPGTPVLTLSPTIDDTLQPIYKFHLTLAQRYPAFLLLPALLRSEGGPSDAPGNSPGAPGSGSFIADPGVTPSPPPKHRIPPDHLAALDRLQHTMMVEDLNRWHPALILVERCQDPTVHCQVLEDRHDDLLAFFLRDPAFARIFAHYHLARTSGPYDAYTLATPF